MSARLIAPFISDTLYPIMVTSALVVTPQNSFGSMMRSSLEETGKYRLFIAGDEPSALVQLKTERCTLAFLDTDLGMDAVAEIGHALRALNPHLKLILVSDEDLPPALATIQPWVLLRKPFYLPELMKMLDSINSSPAHEENTASSPDLADLPWLADVNKAAQRLTRLTLESSAQAALITRGKTLWAYAGQFSQETANELVRLVTRNWDEQNGGDLLRFARLETTRAEHMLYATTLSAGTILALVFDAETPFSTIRTQANSLARSLSVEKTGPIAPFVEQTPRKPEPAKPVMEETGKDIPSIAQILFDIPTPIPRPREEPIAPVMRLDIPEETSAPVNHVDISSLETRKSTPLAEMHIISRESSPAVRRDMEVDELDATVKHEVEELEVTAPSKMKRPPTPVRTPQPGELDGTRPHSITEVAGRNTLEPVSAGMYHLNYACLLVPRFSSHYMTGDLADRLGEWFPGICIAFGWRLEFMAVRPEYLQWVVSVPPNTSPGYLMRIMRQQTSEKIFAEFPRIKKENPSGDFWAPGYLIMGGSQPHPQQLVKDYIKQTRDRQGISQPRT